MTVDQQRQDARDRFTKRLCARDGDTQAVPREFMDRWWKGTEPSTHEQGTCSPEDH